MRPISAVTQSARWNLIGQTLREWNLSIYSSFTRSSSGFTSFSSHTVSIRTPYPPFYLPPDLLSVFARPIQGHKAHRTYKDYTRECEQAIYFVWSTTDLRARGQSPFLPVQRQISSSPAHGKYSHKDKKQIRSVHPSLFLYAIITNRSHCAIHFKATKPCIFSTSTILLCFSQTPSKLWGYTEADLSRHIVLSFKKENGGKQEEKLDWNELWTHWNCCIKLHFPADLWRRVWGPPLNCKWVLEGSPENIQHFTKCILGLSALMCA